jgi:hypothetical protein
MEGGGVSTIRCGNCKGIIRPNEECLIDDNGADIHGTCPTLFGEPYSAGLGGAARGLFAPLELEPDKGAA